MVDDQRLDGDYWGPGKLKPGTGGEVRPIGPPRQDPYGHVVLPVPGGSVGPHNPPPPVNPNPWAR
jgi:hypothetical protein